MTLGAVAEFCGETGYRYRQTISNQGNTRNSGMFLFRASSYLKRIRKYLSPEIYKACEKAVDI